MFVGDVIVWSVDMKLRRMPRFCNASSEQRDEIEAILSFLGEVKLVAPVCFASAFCASVHKIASFLSKTRFKFGNSRGVPSSMLMCAPSVAPAKQLRPVMLIRACFYC